MVITINNDGDRPIGIEVEDEASININPNSNLTMNVFPGAHLEFMSDYHIKHTNGERPQIINN